MVPGAAPFGRQFRYLPAQPEMKALPAAAPQDGSSLPRTVRPYTRT
jgi:hypothetical protein